MRAGHRTWWALGGGTLLLLLTAAIWRFCFAMPPTPLTEQAFLHGYDYPRDHTPLVLNRVSSQRAHFAFDGWDGDRVYGSIEWPSDPALRPAEGFPVLLGISAMGHSAKRWWQAEYKGRPTVTETHQIRAMAIAAGYAVVAIDNRYTDSRKQPDYVIDEIMWDLHVYGDKRRYEQMVHGTVLDLRQLLDKLALQPELDLDRLTVAGYSMGAQVGFLLAGVDTRVRQLVAMVPPHLDDRTAMVAPKNAAPLIRTARVLLLTADDDPYASATENAALFAVIASPNKQHVRHASGHVLPASYLEVLQPLFVR